jgi:TPR repeat protein
LYEKSANQGDPNAQYNLARYYTKGIGVEINKEEAFKWYEKSANQGYPYAKYNLKRFVMKK